jgi:hypothetical protein
MSHEVALPGAALERLVARRQGLRIATAVAVGFTIAVWAKEAIPFLVPVFASQFLTTSRRPPSLAQGLLMIGLVFVAAQALALAVSVLTGYPLVLGALLWLLYFVGFYLQAEGKGGAANFIILVIGIIVPLLEIEQVYLGESIVAALTKAAIGGVVLAWGAHALWPAPAGDAPQPSAGPASRRPAHQALASASILLASVVLCFIDHRLSFALIIPITVASLLGQLDLATTQRTALGLVIVNLLGGLVASFAFAFVSLRPSLPAIFLVTLIVALVFGGRAAADPRMGKISAGALTTFLVLLGLGVSPLPGSPSEFFSTRIAYVLFVILYTLCLAALLWPNPKIRPVGETPASPLI